MFRGLVIALTSNLGRSNLWHGLQSPMLAIFGKRRMIDSTVTYIPPKVSRRYRFDWQYAVDYYRKPVIRTAPTVIFVMPLLVEVTRSFGINWQIPLSLWLTWISSTAFILAWATIGLCCPRFIREYRDFGEYEKRSHSHRWIVWEFYNNIRSLNLWQNIVRETIEKGLSRDCDDERDPELGPVCCIFPHAPGSVEVSVFSPIQVQRDIYLPVIDLGRRYQLPMREEDPQLAKKEKELFWILYSQAAQERPTCRALFWIFFYFAVAAFSVSIVWNAIRVVKTLY